MDFPKRKPNRLSCYDYSTPGAYFLTICVEGRKCILGRIVGGGNTDAPKVALSAIGTIVQRNIESSKQIPRVYVDKYVIMPNHIHLLLLVDAASPNETPRSLTPANAVIPRYVSALKRFCHKTAGIQIFQRSYHDHVIRDESDYRKIWNYIDTNPARWQEDCFFKEDTV